MNKHDSITITKLANGYVIAPNNNSFPSYSNCIFIEGFDLWKLVSNLAKVLDVEVTQPEEK